MQISSQGRFHWKSETEPNIKLTLMIGGSPQTADTVLTIDENHLQLFAASFEEAMTYIENAKVVRNIYAMTNRLPKYMRSLGITTLTELINDCLQDIDAAVAEWGISKLELENLLTVYRSI